MSTVNARPAFPPPRFLRELGRVLFGLLPLGFPLLSPHLPATAGPGSDWAGMAARIGTPFLLLAFFVALLPGFGATIRRWTGWESRFEATDLVIDPIVGICALNAIVFIAGIAGLYFPAGMLGLLVLVSFVSWDALLGMARRWRDRLFVSRPALKFWQVPGRFIVSLGLLASGVLVGYILMAKMLFPDYGADIFYYISYYKNALSNHSYLPNEYDNLVYFPNKSSGLHYIIAATSGLNNIQVASGVYFTFLCLSMMLFMKNMTRNYLFIVLPIIILSSNNELLIFTNNFSKSNFLGAVIIFFQNIVAYQILFSGHAYDRKSAQYALVALAIQTSLFSFLTIAFSFTFSAVCLVGQTLAQRRLARPFLFHLLSLSLATMTVWSFNYLLTGLFDLATFSIQQKMGLIQQTAYLGPTTLFLLPELAKSMLFVNGMPQYVNNFLDLLTSTGFIPSTFLNLLFLTLPAGLIRFTPRPRLAARHIHILFLGFNGLTFIIYATICACISSNYIMKHSSLMFGIFHKIIFFSACPIPLLSLLQTVFRKHMSSSMTQAVTVALTALLCIPAMIWAFRGHPHNIDDDARVVREYLQGNKTREDVYFGYYPEMNICKKALQAIGQANTGTPLILPLSPMSACSGYYLPLFIEHTASFFDQRAKEIFGQDSDIAATALVALGVEYLIIDLNRDPVFIAYAPVFSPRSLTNRFVLAAELADGVFLLRIAQDASLPPPLPERLGDYLKRDSRARETFERYARFLQNL